MGRDDEERLTADAGFAMRDGPSRMTHSDVRQRWARDSGIFAPGAETALRYQKGGLAATPAIHRARLGCPLRYR